VWIRGARKDYEIASFDFLGTIQTGFCKVAKIKPAISMVSGPVRDCAESLREFLKVVQQ
jgi:hypothetical protein